MTQFDTLHRGRRLLAPRYDLRTIPTFVARISQTARDDRVTFFESDSLRRTGGTTMNLFDILTSVILLGSAYLLLFTALVREVGGGDKPAP